VLFTIVFVVPFDCKLIVPFVPFKVRAVEALEATEFVVVEVGVIVVVEPAVAEQVI